MIANDIFVPHEAGSKDMDALPGAALRNPEVMRVAAQIRAMGIVGKKVTLFAPVGPVSAAVSIVQNVAEALAVIDRTQVLIINLNEAQENSPTGISPVDELEIEISDDALFFEKNRRGLDGLSTPVSHIYALAPRSVDTLPVVIARARARVGHVFIDAPSIVDSAATSLAAAYADAVVLLIQKSKSAQREIKIAQQQFQTLGAQVVGFIFIE